jgi:hypothetical protein
MTARRTKATRVRFEMSDEVFELVRRGLIVARG